MLGVSNCLPLTYNNFSQDGYHLITNETSHPGGESILSEGLGSSSLNFSVTGHCWPHPPPQCQTFPGSHHSLLAFAHCVSFPCLFLVTRSHCVTHTSLEHKISPASASQTLGVSVQDHGCLPSPPDTLTWSVNFQVQSFPCPGLDHLEFCWIWF